VSFKLNIAHKPNIL